MTEIRSDTITITIDGKAVECRPGELLIEVAKRAGIYIPYFCYHPRMDPVGACRMCLVNVQPGPPKPQTSCTTRVADGMVVETQFVNTDIQAAQQGVLEFLLINHPLDCPICDRGGECPLQDQTQDYGAAESRYVENKRRFEKPVKISPLVNLDRERCILCYRCTRFCEELSGDVLIGVMERGPHAYIYPFEEGGFDSYFSGNTIQICPVGALTSREYRFMARPWDLQVVGTTCNLCASGCSVHAGVRVQDGNVARFSSATNEDTNEEWLCDKGRFGNAYISSTERLTYPYVRKDDDLVPANWDVAFTALRDGLKPVIDGARSAMIIGESLCDEDAYVAQKFARLVLKTNNVDHRLEGGLSIEALQRPSLDYDDVLSSDLAVLVGLDAREELPILFLRMRIAATKRGLRVATVHQRDVALSEYGDAHLRPLPGAEASSAAAVLAALGGSGADADAKAFADALRSAERAVILLGPRMHEPVTIRAWRAVAEATGAKLSWVPRRSGTYGALAAGAHPDLLPGWREISDDAACGQIAQAWGAHVPAEPGLDVAGILSAAANGELEALWLVGADVLADVPDPSLALRALEAAPFVVLQDVQSTQLLRHADLVLPAAAFVERSGTLTDWEGRRQDVAAAVDPPGAARADYAILAECARFLGTPIGCRTLSDTKAELDMLLASAPSANPPIAETTAEAPVQDDATADGDLRLLSYRLLYDAGSRASRSDGIRELTREAFAEINIDDAQSRGIADGQKVTVSSNHGSITVVAQVSKTIRGGVVFVPWNQPGATAQTLVAIDDRNPVVTLSAGGGA
jgi:NADH-quinone oxidoreductase subunit G